MIEFFTWPRSSGGRVQWALEELGVPYEQVVLDSAKGEHKAPAYLAVHPGGKIPGLVDGDDRVFESAAIIAYLGEKYGTEKGLWPKGGADRAAALSWAVWSITELHGFMMQFAYHGLDSPVSYKPEDRSKAAAAYSRSQFDLTLDALERQLTGREHVLGSTFSLVDVTIASGLDFGKMIGVDLGARPALTAWLARCTARPARARVT